MNDKLLEGESDDPWPVLLHRCHSGLSDHKVLSGPIARLGYRGLYLGHGDYIHDDEGFQPYIWLRLPFPRVRVGHGGWDISWMQKKEKIT